MPEYGDIAFTVQNVYVAPLNTDNTFGTPGALEYVQSFSYDPLVDEDTIKAQGGNREKLTVIIGAESTLEEASLKATAVDIITGYTSSESGTTPNRVRTVDGEGAGSGKPYVGVVIVIATTNNGRLVYGFPRSMVKGDPQFQAGQNEFRTGEFGFEHLLTTINKYMRMKRYESASDVPDFSVAANWDTYFTGIFS